MSPLSALLNLQADAPPMDADVPDAFLACVAGAGEYQIALRGSPVRPGWNVHEPANGGALVVHNADALEMAK